MSFNPTVRKALFNCSGNGIGMLSSAGWRGEESTLFEGTIPQFVKRDQGKQCKSHSGHEVNSVTVVRERTIPTERPPLVGGVIANFSG
jgi:hypothetical protein